MLRSNINKKGSQENRSTSVQLACNLLLKHSHECKKENESWKECLLKIKFCGPNVFECFFLDWNYRMKSARVTAACTNRSQYSGRTFKIQVYNVITVLRDAIFDLVLHLGSLNESLRMMIGLRFKTWHRCIDRPRGKYKLLNHSIRLSTYLMYLFSVNTEIH